MLKNIFKDYKEWIFISIFYTILFSFLLTDKKYILTLDNQMMDVQIGDKYLYSYDWNNKNPFQPKNIDTIIVTSINGDYVQWMHNNKFQLSTKLVFFKNNIREIK